MPSGIFLEIGAHPRWRILARTDGTPQAEACSTQQQRQECGVQPQAPEEDALGALEPFDGFPALNTESCSVCRLLSHFGHSIFWLLDITMRS
jgi:hypothetical protein